MTEIEGKRFAVSLRLAAWLALRLDDRPDSLQIEIAIAVAFSQMLTPVTWPSPESQTTMAISASGGSVE